MVCLIVKEFWQKVRKAKLNKPYCEKLSSLKYFQISTREMYKNSLPISNSKS